MAARRDRERAYYQWPHPLRRMVHDEVGQALLVTLLVVAGIWGFVGLASEVVEGDTRAFDHWLLQTLRSPEDPAWPRGPR